jgi:hypothetical protein
MVKNIWHGIKNIIIPDRVANWKVIILCIIGATTFWFFNSLNKSYTTTISYPINLIFDESKYIAVSQLPSRVQINLTGGGWNLIRRTNWFNIEPIILVLEDPLQRRVAGNSFRSSISDQLDEFQLNFIVTDSLALNIENKIDRKLKLKIDSASISLDENHYLISPISLSVDSAIFTGPESMMTLLNNEFLVEIPEQAIDGDYLQMVIIKTGADHLFSVNPPNVGVSFEVRRFLRVSKTVKSTLINFPADSSWYVRNPNVTISFMVREDRAATDSSAFEIILDLSRMARADSTIQPLIRKYPGDVLDINIESGRVKVSHD